MTRAVGYIRVSTPRQQQEGVSLEMQARQIAARCAERGWQLLEVYADPGVSGTRRNRQGLGRLLAQADAGEIDAVVVYDQSRLARDTEYVLRIFRELTNRGIQLELLTQPVDFESPEGRLQVTVVGAVDEYRSREGARRVRAALLHKAQRGEWVGRAPFGWRLVEKKLVAHRTEARLVRRVFRDFLEEHRSAGAIARWLTAACGGGPAYGAWSANDVKRLILRNPVHMGAVPWRGDLYPGRHKALVSQEVWERAQALLRQRARAGREPRGDYLLSGLLRCPRCGGPMGGHSHRSQRESGGYAFASYDCSAGKAGAGRCPGWCISQGRADRLVIEFLRFLSRATAQEIRELPRRAPDEEERDALRARLERFPEERQRLVRLHTRGIIAEEELVVARRDLEAEAAALRAELEPEPRPPPASALRRRFGDLAHLLEAGDVAVQRKRDLLADLVDSVVIERTQPDGHWRYRVRMQLRV